MEEVQRADADSPTQSPLPRAEGNGGQLQEEDIGRSTRRKRRKREGRPESIVVYRSDRKKGEGASGGEGATERTSEEGDQFLSTPSGAAGGWSSPSESGYVTLTGTITRGKQKGQVVDIHVTLTEKELRELTRSKERLDAECESGADPKRSCGLGLGQGPHVLLWSVSCAPVVFVLSFITSFYYGTLTWYNVFLVYNEERTFWHKITICPFLIIFYPLLIMVLSVSLAVYAAVVQVSWAFREWWLAVRDLEKGFCGWVCGKLGLEDCAPYSIVELLDSNTISWSHQDKLADESPQTTAV